MSAHRLLTRLFYISEIAQPLTSVDLQLILGAAQVKNRRADITGMLIKTDGHFLQVLEGRSDTVAKLMNTIALDGRHCNVQQVLEESASTRLFAQWSMGLALSPEMSPELQSLHRAGTMSFDEAHALMSRVDLRRAAGEAAWA